jgi:hypothetical protein
MNLNAFQRRFENFQDFVTPVGSAAGGLRVSRPQLY